MKKIKTFNELMELPAGKRLIRVKNGQSKSFVFCGAIPEGGDRPPETICLREKNNVHAAISIYGPHFDTSLKKEVWLAYDGNQDYDSKLEGEEMINQHMRAIERIRKIYVKPAIETMKK